MLVYINVINPNRVCKSYISQILFRDLFCLHLHLKIFLSEEFPNICALSLKVYKQILRTRCKCVRKQIKTYLKEAKHKGFRLKKTVGNLGRKRWSKPSISKYVYQQWWEDALEAKSSRHENVFQTIISYFQCTKMKGFQTGNDKINIFKYLNSSKQHRDIFRIMKQIKVQHYILGVASIL